ncbi:hypothetical protein L914_19746, partial [Phytophthora nicotianae]
WNFDAILWSLSPSADYFNSNLMIQNFVIADISQGRNNVYMSGAKEKMRMHSVGIKPASTFSTTVLDRINQK